MDVQTDVVPAWLRLAQSEADKAIKEVVGPQDNPRILEYFNATTYKAAHDEVPWCSAFVSWCLEHAGYISTRSAAAKSYINFGEKCDVKPGAVLVMSRGVNLFHVTFCKIVEGDIIHCLGGNQHDQVCTRAFPHDHLVASNWPILVKK